MGYADAYPGGYSAAGGDPILAAYIETTAGVWYDISDRVLSGSIRRGRQDQLDQYEAGTCDLTLANKDRMFDPNYAASPLNGHILPMKRVKLEGTWGGLTYGLFYGYVDRWVQNRGELRWATTSVQATDGFKILERAALRMDVDAELSGSRVDTVLDEIGWADDAGIDAGDTSLQAMTDVRMSALDHLQTVAQTEFGNLFVMADGMLRFLSRHASINQAPSEAFSDAAGTDLPIVSSNPELSDEQIRNDVTISREGGTEQHAEDATSIATYGISSFELDGLYHTDDSYSQQMADFIVQSFKDPVERVESMTINPYADEGLWPAALGLELTNRVTLEETPSLVAPAVTRTLVVEGISHTFAGKQWETSFNLSENAVATLAYWELGEAGYSELGQTTRLFF